MRSHVYNKRRRKDLIFYICLAALPMAQFLMMWVYVKAEAIMLAFKSYDRGEYIWVGLQTFKNMLHEIGTSSNMRTALSNSVLLFLFNNLMHVPPTLIFAYVVYKKMPLGKSFKVISYIPTMFSVVVKVMIYQYFCEEAIPAIINLLTGKEIQGLLSNINTRQITIWFYSSWIGFGANIILYVNQMDSISDSIVEAAKLDGIGFWQEFWYITFPMVFSLFNSLFTMSIPAILGNQFMLVEFYGLSCDPGLWTIGYYTYAQMINGGPSYYPFLSSLGLIMTAVTVPIVLLTRKWFNRIDPMQN